MKTICLDPAAHWPDNIGLEGYSERDGAWEIADACRSLLERTYPAECRVVLTRDDKDDLKWRYPKYLNEEVRRINASGADYALSIHTDASSSATARGVTCFKGGPLSASFGQSLLDAIAANFTAKELPLFFPTARDHYKGRTYLAVHRNTTKPTVLFECGFHTNKKDMKLLVTPEGRQRIGYALADGIAEFFGWEAGMSAEPDVDKWAEPWVQRAIDEGLLTGYPDGSFRGRQAVTRQELAVALVRLKDRLSLNSRVPSG